MYTAVLHKTKLGGFLAALLFRANREVVFWVDTEKEQDPITLKSETEGYFIVYPEYTVEGTEKSQKIELVIVDLEDDRVEEVKKLVSKKGRIYFCLYTDPKNPQKEEEIIKKYENLLLEPLGESPTVLAKLVADLEEKERDFIFHRGGKICEFDLERKNKIHRFDVEMIEDLMEEIGLWCVRKEG